MNQRQVNEILAQHPDHKANLVNRRTAARRRLAHAQTQGNQVSVRRQTRIINQLTREINA